MKTIGMLGGTGWSSTIEYYRIINEMVGARLGGYHSAEILLKSIDYHGIMSNYGKDHLAVAQLLKQELEGLIALRPGCIIICCNSLHKYYDQIKYELKSDIPVMHAIELVAEHLLKIGQKSALLLATKFTMEDGFFAQILESKGIAVTIPEQSERNKMQEIHTELMHNKVTKESCDYFAALIGKYRDCGNVILGCTEYPLVVNQDNSPLPIINPVDLQAQAAVDYALAGYSYG